MNNPLLQAIIVLLSFLFTTQIQSQEPKEIILLIGQSNMSGRADLLDQDYQIVQNAFLLDSTNQWIPLKSPLNIHSSIRKVAPMQRFNLGYTFAQEILAEDFIKPIGLVVNARGVPKLTNGFPKLITLRKPSEEVNQPLEIGERSLPVFGFREKAT
ncbi:sialate O-acetylesterase [Flavobacteriaceae bacterium]|nr:sialate O-acetylesterase [Flavobacteriaceae bacterium]